MPTVDIDTDELRTLTGHDDKSDDDLRDDLFELGLEYEGETDEGELRFEFEPDRLDRLSVEGVARSLRYQYGDDRGVYVPKTNDADWTIHVEDVPEERPYVTGAVVRGLDLDEASLDSLIQLQEKLHATMGRKRAKGAIGVHDLTMLKGASAGGDGEKSVRYTGIDRDGDTFVPLEGDAEMTPGEVLSEHHIGTEYADLVAEYDTVPAIYDSIGLFSFPPVVNGRRTEVSTESRDLFIEMTGTDQWTIDHMLSIVCYALDARGGTIESVRVEYESPPEEYRESLVRPDFSTKTKTVAHDRIERTLGIELEPEDVIDLLERSGLDGEIADETGEPTETAGSPAYDVTIPPYRVDVLHPVDVIDDVGRAYGFNNLDPRYPAVGTIGGRHERARLEEAVRTALVGFGFQDLLNFHLTSAEELHDRMKVGPRSDVLGGGDPVEVRNPYSEDYTVVRTWLLPSIMQVLENNTHRRYPQDLAEVGFVAERDDEVNTGVAEARHVAGALARHDVSYEDAKARLQALVADFDAELATPPTDHPSFIDGRTAAVEIDGDVVGVIGELHPSVLVEHDLELPVVAFEFTLAALR
ncbi:Phenylalanine--tRNA ligase beta subunit protein [Halorhabdus tiamatea SARL4B]|uniref:Phenylalanine--tRNA ligase beta subunit n=1 Tax=Halorhabdus tiamatea SARL4B TaxID=1033806 RepID=F7PK10_9EURY|nr:phenylalanine--tRNA ligase subunit beta [Halorhabdus tiamatea]ERJ07540.1 Phenylalanine--tRNA ligase beta subunit protein [Halorhabdus tiamatea SARL4B]CCQ33512.1 phenylalanyl-tRNA synthetase beta chain [Halorhabdus tiamatea SARL4B]